MLELLDKLPASKNSIVNRYQKATAAQVTRAPLLSPRESASGRVVENESPMNVGGGAV